MTRPTISCIVPCFNSERYVAETLDSIFAQTYRPIEVIVADDGSTDNTVALARGYDVVIVTQPDRGPAATRNLGLRNATGEFVAFLDADDLWHPEKLSRQYQCFLDDPDLQYCVSHAQMFWTADMKAERAQLADHVRTGPVPGYATTTLLARRSLFDRLGLLDEQLRFGDAVEWFMRAADQHMKMRLLDDVLTYHRMHDNNLTRRLTREAREEYLTMVRASLRRRRGESPA